MQIVSKSSFARLDDDDDHQTEKAIHFGGCPNKDGSCHSDRCERWPDGYWVPKSKVFFDEAEKQWYIDRRFAEENDIVVSEDEYSSSEE